MVDVCDLSEWKIVAETTNAANLNGFWEAVRVWTEKPHVINRRINGVAPLISFSLKLQEGSGSIDVFTSLETVLHDLDFSDLTVTTFDRIASQFVTRGFSCVISSTVNVDSDVVVHLRQLLPKQPDKHRVQYEAVVNVRGSNTVGYVPILPVEQISVGFSYALRYLENSSQNLQMLVKSSHSECASLKWLHSKVFPKFCKWAEEVNGVNNNVAARPSSLTLIPVVRYFERYHNLKKKYGHQFVQLWPEKTDPSKFVHEDVAIAAYLLVTWEVERQEKGFSGLQSFADLGCGNGLLTYILSSEGHTGTGYDVRRRKIWDTYNPPVALREQPIIPTDVTSFADVDWLIGNHSDELTPWIPVMAARASYETRFFVLPCCAYDFYGKYQRRAAGTSTYSSYLAYVREVGQACGFNVSEDRLRIPSTKRVCFVGQRLTHDTEEWNSVRIQVADLIARASAVESSERHFQEMLIRNSRPCTKRLGTIRVDSENQNKPATFRVRASKEPVRNCTQVEASVKEDIVLKVARALLAAESREEDNGPLHWKAGGQLLIRDLVPELTVDLLQELRKECGGLKTLLKNHYHIFEVHQDKVRLRNYAKKIPLPRRQNRLQAQNSTDSHKTKSCWFHDNHPDGCPLEAIACRFAHGASDLKMTRTV